MNLGPYDPNDEAFLANLRLGSAVHEVLRSDPDPARAVSKLLARRDEFLIPLRAGHSELQASALDLFADAFDALELAILLGQPVEARNRWAYYDYSWEGAGERALTELFRSGMLAAGEVLVLMRAGYTTGALARWRALHEIATRAEFMSGGGLLLFETAHRYLQHEEYRQLLEIERREGWMRKIDPSRAMPRESWNLEEMARRNLRESSAVWDRISWRVRLGTRAAH
jgi:hypothetical protein